MLLIAPEILNYINGGAPLTIVGPVRIQVFNTTGNEVYPGPGQIVQFTAASTSEKFATNSTSVLFTNTPSQSIIDHWFIYDSSPTPKAIWGGVFERIRTVPQGDSFEIPIGELRVELE